ncbi:MAG: lipoate--protein ligase, partial [Spirochaetales bacterium]|nr:lipoate--protein ligase [Spirochaetales bacterium]
MKPAVYTTSCHDIHSNLAAEAFLMERSKADEYILYLWQNRPTVVIGRYQNPFMECDLARMESDGVKLSRRFSGGGAVYHDMGNLCFTFISPKESYDKDRNFRIVISALGALGVEACTSGRNDILAGGFKVSGNAFQIKGGKACHHGTLLVDCDMSRLPRYLTPDATKLEAHGVRSVASRVRNLKEIRPDITIGALEEQLVRSFSEECG